MAALTLLWIGASPGHAQATNGIVQGQKAIDALVGRKSDLVRELSQTRDKALELRTRQRAGAQAGQAKPSEQTGAEITRLDQRVQELEGLLRQVDAELTEQYRSARAVVGGARTEGPLEVGDALEIFVKEDESFNGTYPIRIGGYIMLPRVGRVFVAGQDLPGAEKAIKAALEAEQVRRATVSVDRKQGTLAEEGTVVFLAGEFARPGILRLPAGSIPTVVGVVLQSGGITEYGDLAHVRLLRLEGSVEITREVNLRSILSDGRGLSGDLSLRPGDIIVVPAKPVLVQVTGSVVEPGMVKFLPGETMTAYLAILRSGGFTRFASRRKVYVLRELGEGRKQRIDVNFKEVQKARASDVVLWASDIVVVPERFLSF